MYWVNLDNDTNQRARLDASERYTLLVAELRRDIAVRMGDAASISNQEQAAIPDAYTLHPGHPNPIRSSTTIAYTLPNASVVLVQVLRSVLKVE